MIVSSCLLDHRQRLEGFPLSLILLRHIWALCLAGAVLCWVRPKAFWRNSLIPIYTSAAKLFLLPTRKTGPVREDIEEMSTQVKDSAIRTHCSGSWALTAWVGNPIRCVHGTLYALLALQGQQQKMWVFFFFWPFPCDWFSLVTVFG